MNKLWKDEKGAAYMDSVMVVLVVIIVLALALKVIPVMVAKSDLNTIANELARVAELNGTVGTATSQKARELKGLMEMDPEITWSRTGKIPLGQEFTVTLALQVDIGFFEFGSFPITLTSKAVGRSEVYSK